jgi:serine/threonine protein kinase
MYQSPEQIFGTGIIGKQSDIFSCGFIMFELITGKHPVMLKGEDKIAYKKRMKDFQAISVGKIHMSR